MYVATVMLTPAAIHMMRVSNSAATNKLSRDTYQSREVTEIFLDIRAAEHVAVSYSMIL